MNETGKQREYEVANFQSPLEALSFFNHKGTSGLSIKQQIDKIARQRAKSRVAFDIEKKKLEYLNLKEVCTQTTRAKGCTLND